MPPSPPAPPPPPPAPSPPPPLPPRAFLRSALFSITSATLICSAIPGPLHGKCPVVWGTSRAASPRGGRYKADAFDYNDEGSDVKISRGCLHATSPKVLPLCGGFRRPWR